MGLVSGPGGCSGMGLLSGSFSVTVGLVGDKELLQSVGFMLGRCLWPMLSDKGV